MQGHTSAAGYLRRPPRLTPSPSPVATPSEVRRARAARDLSTLAVRVFPAITANTLGWCGYAYATADAYIFVSNAPGVLLGFYFMSSALQYGDLPARRAVERQLLAQLGLCLLVAAVATIALSSHAATMTVLGSLACFNLLLLYGAPLSEVAEVLRTRCSGKLMWPLIVASMANGGLWTAYGLARSDAFIYAPNAAGVAMALMQATLKLRFPSGVAGTAKAQAELKRTPSSEPLAAEGLQGVQDI